MDLTVLYRDDGLMAVDKPSGMLVHRGWARDDVVLVDLVRTLSGMDIVHPIHRLDRQTSGVVLFALAADLAQKLSEAFSNGEIQKNYLALVRGEAPERAVVDHPISRREGGPRVAAATEVERIAVLDTEPRHVSLVSARPRTGRLHQVRRHLKHLSHPVIGDANYGKGDINRAFRQRYGLERMALHAASLSFVHPLSGEAVAVHSPLPPDLVGPLGRMGLDFGVLRNGY